MSVSGTCVMHKVEELRTGRHMGRGSRGRKQHVGEELRSRSLWLKCRQGREMDKGGQEKAGR